MSILNKSLLHTVVFVFLVLGTLEVSSAFASSSTLGAKSSDQQQMTADRRGHFRGAWGGGYYRNWDGYRGYNYYPGYYYYPYNTYYYPYNSYYYYPYYDYSPGVQFFFGW